MGSQESPVALGCLAPLGLIPSAMGLLLHPQLLLPWVNT